jgi:adenine-specific DNA-methyltransferase
VLGIDGGINFTTGMIESLPIPEINTTELQKSFIEIVDKILVITKSSDYLENPDKQAQVKEYEKEIDQMVYTLYGLTPAEKDIVEGR